MRTTSLLIIIICLSEFCFAQQHKLTKLWATDTVLAQPESVLLNTNTNLLYTSLMNGNPWEKDGIGEIGILSPSGEIINSRWLTGLNAPKGMANFQDTLFVADITELIIISISRAVVIRRIELPGSVGLNDVTVDERGTVYLSDSKAGKIFKYSKGVVSLYLEKLSKPNGLKYLNESLYFLASGVLYRCDSGKSIIPIVKGMDENTDGIQIINKGEFLITCYTGVIYYTREHGKLEVLIDTRSSELYTGDIQFDNKSSTLFVPGLFSKTITAYKCK